LGNFPEDPKIVEFPKGELFNRKILEIPGGMAIRTVIPGKKFSKISVFFPRFSSIPEIAESVVPFLTGNFRKLLKAEIFHQMEGAANLFFVCGVEWTT